MSDTVQTSTVKAGAIQTSAPPSEFIELDIQGMTCASCANRIERKLNKMDGVAATVNYATDTASVHAPASVTTADLIATVEAAGYHATVPKPPAQEPISAGAEPADSELHGLRDRLWISAALALPVLLLSMVPALQFDNWQWLSLTLASPVVVWGAWPFHRAAAVNARHGAATMDTLVSIGVSAAYLWSLYALFFGHAGISGMKMPFELFGSTEADAIYLEIAAVVTVFILGGRYFEARAKTSSGAALTALLALGAKQANVVRGDKEVAVPIENLAIGDVVVIRPGETVPADGTVQTGTSAVDASMITGEPVPVEVGPGDAVIGGTVNAGGRLIVAVSRVGKDSQLAKMAALVKAAQSGKAPIQRLADRISGVFVPVVIVLALATLVGWLISGADTEQAFTAAVAVLIIACPCALGLATPTALLVGTGRGAQIGVLIRGPEILENTRRVDTIVLDKTGTLTTGQMSVREILPASGFDDLLNLAGSVEHNSEHPIGKAIAAAMTTPPSQVESFRATGGLGVAGIVDGRAVAVGRPAWLAEEWAVQLPQKLADAVHHAEQQGGTAVAVAVDGVAAGVIVVGDSLRPTSAQAVRAFVGLGLKPVLLTGDNRSAAESIAASVGIATVHAEVLPERKVAVVKQLQAEGRVVAMVGDGVNDAAALAQADLGLAMGSGTDVAIEAADLTLVRPDLMLAADAIRLSRSTLRTIQVNLFWAFAYNVAAIPLAIAGLLGPLVAGAAMALSSVLVVANSLRLRSFRPLTGRS